MGVAGRTRTTIDGGGLGNAVTIDDAEGSGTALRGFTVSNGAAGTGAGILVRGAFPTLVDLVVSGNVAGDDGGGIACVEGSVCTLENLEIANNIAGYSSDAGGCWGEGGGIAVHSSTLTLENVVIWDNDAGHNGGGLNLRDASLVADHTVFVGNSASGGGGGGIWASSSELSLTNAYFMGNVTLCSYSLVGDGGGIFASTSSLVLAFSAVVDNAAGTDGAGLWLSDTLVWLLGSVIANNRVWYGAGGGLTSTGFGNVVATFNDNWGNTPTDWSGLPDPTGTDGNVSVDPLFLDVCSSRMLYAL